MELATPRAWMKECVLTVLTSLALVVGSLAVAGELAPKLSLPESDTNNSTPVELIVRAASAGITTAYYERAVVAAINASDIFADADDQHYSLEIRVVRVITPSFSRNMTVSMKAVWKLGCTGQKTPLLEENILSSYTGGTFEGGLIGANRVRVAMEGASRASVRNGMELLAAYVASR